MPSVRKISGDSAAVQAHLSITQAVIQRMAANSASCKAWCITLVAAILVIVAEKDKPNFTLIALIPTILFLILDVYYLALERYFRQTYNLFINKLHSHTLVATDLYAVAPRGLGLREFVSSILSFSIWPFYLTLTAMIWLTRSLVTQTP